MKGEFCMSVTAKKILDDIVQLPIDEQLELAEKVLSNLDQEPSKEVDAAWRAEVRRRIAQIKSGGVTCIPWEEAREQLWARSNAKP
jgi:putative addiction module component (TIGR02574 family)